MKLYLAGPEVFLPEAVEIGKRKREICARHGHIGLFPLDNEIEPDDETEPLSRLIFLGNLQMIEMADAVVANLSPFRGVSADPGTVFETGYARAAGKPIFGYTSDARTLVERVAEQQNGPLTPGADGRLYAADGLAVENFGLFDNLMIAEALAHLAIDDRAGATSWTDLTLFEKCVAAIGRRAETSARRATGA